MLGQALGGQAGREVPATARLAALVVAQRIGQRLGNFLRRGSGQIMQIGVGFERVGHGRRLCRTFEQNKNQESRRFARVVAPPLLRTSLTALRRVACSIAAFSQKAKA
jgi:hypothetical protein